MLRERYKQSPYIKDFELKRNIRTLNFIIVPGSCLLLHSWHNNDVKFAILRHKCVDPFYLKSFYFIKCTHFPDFY